MNGSLEFQRFQKVKQSRKFRWVSMSGDSGATMWGRGDKGTLEVYKLDVDKHLSLMYNPFV